MNLQDLVIQHAQNRPDDLAVKGPDMSLTYSELDRLANRFTHALAKLGVRPGDRVGIWLGKSARAVAAMQAVLRLSAIYVPLDPLSPGPRIRTIVEDCDMRALVTTQQRAQALQTDDLQVSIPSSGSRKGLDSRSLPPRKVYPPSPNRSSGNALACLCVENQGSGTHWDNLMAFPDTAVEASAATESDAAYILYTSGSTGKPKGVCISHRNALSFVEWASQELGATATDRFANHAPFHFDLSVLDLYVAFHAGAATYLIPDEVSYIPQHLVSFLVQHAITVWYSVPSVLILMMEQAGLLDVAVSSLALRAILFAGEPFPIKHLRRLYQHYSPSVRFFNLYGPTETNVCTSYEVTHIPEDWNKPVPIGKACSGDHVWAQKDDGEPAQAGEEGELMVTGPTVMLGYWGQPAHGDKPYATGDLVQLRDDGNFVYIGRRDRQVKIRGHRIELGDIEAVLEAHPNIHEIAVIVVGTGLEARLVAFVVPASETVPSLLEIKRLCAERLPRYMIIDDFYTISALPRTRNGKIDRFALAHAL